MFEKNEYHFLLEYSLDISFEGLRNASGSSMQKNSFVSILAILSDVLHQSDWLFCLLGIN